MPVAVASFPTSETVTTEGLAPDATHEKEHAVTFTVSLVKLAEPLAIYPLPLVPPIFTHEKEV